MTIVTLTGIFCLARAIFYFPVEKLDSYFFLLSVFTISIGSFATVPIPRFKSRISVSDTFIFLALLVYGGEMAVILSAVEAFCSAWRFCNKKITVVFNAATMAVSTTAVVFALRLAGITLGSLRGSETKIGDFLIGLSMIAVTQFLVNTSIASVYDAIKHSIPWWSTWKNKYIWTFLTYFIGVAAAGILYQLSDTIGFGIIIATFPVIFFIFLTYKMYLENIEMSMQQAEQAHRHAEILRKQSDALRESEERFRSAFHYAPIGIALLSASGRWLKVNHALCRILGYTEKEFLLIDLDTVLFSEDRRDTIARIRDVFSGELSSWEEEQRYRHKSGKTVWASWSVSAISDSESGSAYLILQLQDITDKKLAEEKLLHEATHDALTGLPNRALFMTKLSEALAKSHDLKDYRVSILFIDLDRFKYVNDSLGHVIGDQLLVKISERLSECLRSSDMVARLGGDEFVILVEGRYDSSETIAIAERIQQKFGLPFILSSNEIYSSASIGILHASKNHRTSEDMMRDADTAMYQAKRAGKGKHEIFDERMHTMVTETLQLETDLRRAVEKEEFSVEYQPIFSLSTGRIEGVHALPRWDHPKFGEVERRKFFTIAEEIGVIGPFGRYFLKRACGEVRRLQAETSASQPFFLCVNLPASQFVQAGLVENLYSILAHTGFLAKDLHLEITESVFLEHQERAISLLHQIRKLGIELKVGDFGTGSSNLSYLMSLPISTVKIDRSFVATIGKGNGKNDLTRAIATLARNLGLKVIAEGVETAEQVEELRFLHCDSAQGKFFGEAMSFEQLRVFLSENENGGMLGLRLDDVSIVPVVQ